MPRLLPDSRCHRANPQLTRLCWQWLALGVLLSAAFPAARGYSPAIGWLWYWLIAAPLLAQCTVHRHTLWPWLRQHLRGAVQSRSKARQPVHRQARRVAVSTRQQVLPRAA